MSYRPYARIPLQSPEYAATQDDGLAPLSIRYLTMIGGWVGAFDTHAEAVAFVEGQRTQGVTGYAYVQTQQLRHDGWMDIARTEWGRGEKLTASGFAGLQVKSN